jgi:iron complex transport system substrate-binding protein
MIMRFLPRRLPVLAVLAALTVTAAACSSPQASNTGATSGSSPSASRGFPVSLKAANGTVKVASRPDAILSLSPTATEMLYAIGAGSQVKAVDSLSDYPPQAPRTKLSAYQPNVEAIVAEKPDLVVESGDTGQLTKRLAAFSIPVLELPAPSNFAGEQHEFDELGQATGHVSQAHQEASQVGGQLRRIAAAAPHHAKPLTYYYELDQTYYSVTSSTFVGQLLALLGMKSIADQASGAAKSGGYPQLSAEYIIKANPDYIILADTVCCHQDAATVAKRPGWSGLAAVKAGHIIGLNDDIASRWGPRVTDLLRTVETAIAKGSTG